MTITKFLLLLILLDLSVCTGCKDKEWTTLPPETQTGANTFGCMIDNELFIGGYFAPWMQTALSASYNVISDKLYIGAYGKINEQAAGSISMEIDTPRENFTQNLSLASYMPSSYHPTTSSTGTICINFETINDGKCTITKLDTIQKIVSGQFEFIGKCTFNYNDSTVTKQLMQGRFDLKFDIINNIDE